MSAAERQRMIDDMSDSDDETIMMMILSQKKKKKFVHSRNRHVFTRSLTVDERRLRSHYIPRCALQDPLLLVMMMLILSKKSKQTLQN